MVRSLPGALLLAICGGLAWSGASMAQAPEASGEPVSDALFPADLLPADRPEPAVATTQLAGESVVYPAPTVPLLLSRSGRDGRRRMVPRASG